MNVSTGVSFAEAAEQVKAHLDIVQIISRYVPTLKKRGRNHLGLCPFHNEKTPSFNVHAEKGLFKCFGCGEGGDALAFLMKIEHKTYAELIEDRAADLGLRIVRDPSQDARHAEQLAERDQLLQLNEAACRWFESLMVSHEGGKAQAYLAGRGYDLGWMRTYRVGLAPNAWDRLTVYLLQQFPFAQDDPTVLERAGLSAPRQREGQAAEGHYDRFRHRLIIPILSPKGEVVGFGGRTLDPEGQPKYLNSPETTLYNKSKTLYGVPQARTAMIQHKRAILMEGYFDVLAAHRAGALEAVATCGTALTLDHLRLLVRLGIETVYCCFDNDTAGRQATLRAIETIQEAGSNPTLKIKVLTLPGGKDPDDYFKQADLADFSQRMANAVDGLTYQLDSQLTDLTLDTLENRLEAASRLTPVLARIPNAVAQSEYTRQYASRLGIAAEALLAEVTRSARVQSSAQPATGSQVKSQQQGVMSPFSSKQATFDLHHPYNSRQSDSPTLGPGNWGTIATGRSSRTFPRKAPPPRPDNFVELHRYLTPHHALAEQRLVSLLFVSQTAIEIVTPLLAALTPTHTWHNPTLAELACQWLALLVSRGNDHPSPSAEDRSEPGRELDTRLTRLMVNVADQPEIRNALSACVFEAERLRERDPLNVLSEQKRDPLDKLSEYEQRQWITQQANTYVKTLRLHHRRTSLTQTNRHLEQIEQTRHNRAQPATPDLTPDSSAGESTLAELLELHYHLKEALHLKNASPWNEALPVATGPNEFDAPAIKPGTGPPPSTALPPSAGAPPLSAPVIPSAVSSPSPPEPGWMEGTSS